MAATFRRLIAASLAAWFLFAVGDLPFVHRCPVHDGGGSSTPVAAEGPHRGGGHAEHRESDQPGEHTCTCVGHCSATSVVALPGRPAATTAAAAPIHQPPRLERGIVPLLVPHSRPFQNGPPHPSV